MCDFRCTLQGPSAAELNDQIRNSPSAWSGGLAMGRGLAVVAQQLLLTREDRREGRGEGWLSMSDQRELLPLNSQPAEVPALEDPLLQARIDGPDRVPPSSQHP